MNLYLPSKELVEFLDKTKDADPALAKQVLTGPMATENIRESVSVLKEGGVVFFFSELTYGVAADATNRSAVEKLYRIKNRPASKPLGVLSSKKLYQAWVEADDRYRDLIDEFWPGYLSVIMKKRKDASGNCLIPDFVTSRQDSVLLMCMDPVAEALAMTADFPIAVSSGNRSGDVPIIDPIEGIREFAGLVDLFLVGSNSLVGINTTILGLTGTTPVILREGPITLEHLRKHLP